LKGKAVTRFEKFVVPAMLLAVILVSAALSQNAQPTAPPAGNGQGAQGDRPARQRGDFDPAAMQQRLAERIKEQLKPSDEEWTVLQPKLTRVMTAQRAARSGMGMGWRGGRGGPDAPDADRPPTTDVERTTRDLRTALDNAASTPADIAAKLTALRESRAKANAELNAAREDLKQVLTARQEAALVMMGMLE
jgi:hypothetical protein